MKLSDLITIDTPDNINAETAKLVVDIIISQHAWALLSESPLTQTKKQAFAQYIRALGRLDFTDPEALIIPEPPTITADDFQSPQVDNVQDRALVAAQNIPGWATWSKETAYSWGMTNIGTPLANGRANLPATLTLTTTRAAILQIITILDAIWVMLWALGQMIIAMRNDR